MTEEETALTIVRLGFGAPALQGRALHFTVQFDSLNDNTKEAVWSIGRYNGFDPDLVIPVLEEIAHYATFGGPSISIGREGSPCIYISQLSTDCDINEPISLLEVDACADEVAEVTGPSAGSSFGRTIRAWWD